MYHPRKYIDCLGKYFYVVRTTHTTNMHDAHVIKNCAENSKTQRTQYQHALCTYIYNSYFSMNFVVETVPKQK